MPTSQSVGRSSSISGRVMAARRSRRVRTFGRCSPFFGQSPLALGRHPVPSASQPASRGRSMAVEPRAQVTRQSVEVGVPDQRFVRALGQLRVGQLVEGTREDRLSGRPRALPRPAADAPLHHVGVQAVEQHARRRHVVDRLGHQGPRNRRSVLGLMLRLARTRGGTSCSIRMTSRVCTNCCSFSVSGPSTGSNWGNRACWMD